MTAKRHSKPRFTLSKSMLRRLPKGQQLSASKDLWEKSGGDCALCDEPLPANAKDIQADHRVAVEEGAGGQDTLDNLYLAHSTCNRLRGNLPFELGHRIVRFTIWLRKRAPATFDDVLDQYVPEARQMVKYSTEGAGPVLSMSSTERRPELFRDPATETPYFFTTVPVTHVFNDTDSQPRDIIESHVRALAIDFHKHPVHEPSNCRLVSDNRGRARLLQFDGQHKTTAQVILDRPEIPMKIYVEPDQVMIQRLVLQVQQGIKKLPLTTSDTLRKLKDVMADLLEAYEVEEGSIRTERGLIEAQPREDQKKVKKHLVLELQRMVLAETKLTRFVGKGKSTTKPLTDTVVVKKMIQPLVFAELLDEDLDSQTSRDYERENVVLILDRISDTLVEQGWKKGASRVDRSRTQNFLYQGSIGWWMNRVLKPAIGTALLLGTADREKLLLRRLKPAERRTIIDLVDALCAWPIWTSPKAPALKAMRSNTARDVEAAFPGYTDVRLVQDLARHVR